jgi:hypothetical protein
MDANDYLSNLPKRFAVSANVITTAGDTLKLNGTAEVVDPPQIRVRFVAEALPEAGRIDREADCLVFIEAGDIVTLICSIEEEPGKDSLALTVHDLIQHTEKREFFRGPAGRLLITWRPRSQPETRKGYNAKGVNISCGGILLIVTRPVEKRTKLMLDIYLPDPVKKTITCEADVLRVNPKKGQERFVAVRFADLESDMCDDIMAFCFAEQRRLLREQVTTRDL